MSSTERRMKRDWSRMVWTRMSGGSVDLSRSSRLKTESTTVTVLVPDCFRIRSEMAARPSSRASERGSSIVSITRPMSPKVITEPSR